MNVEDLGKYIRDQRRGAEISLRQLAKLAGVSNPYLSQIERGLRQPSAEILQQIARGLRISAEALYVQAGILDERRSDTAVPEAVLQDRGLGERQKQVLLEIYESFRRENDAKTAPAEPSPVKSDPAESSASSPTAGPTPGTAAADPPVGPRSGENTAEDSRTQSAD